MSGYSRNRLSVRALLALAFAGLAPAGAHGQIWIEGIHGDLPNVPAPVPNIVIPGPGVTHVGRGLIGFTTFDVDFITITVPFSCSTFIVDIDDGTPTQNSLLGVGPIGNYPIYTNDDDFDGPLDQFAGHFLYPKDSALDLVAAQGGPVTGGSQFTIGITISGDPTFTGQFQDAKLEWDLYVYAVLIPSPGTAALVSLAGLAALRRRR